MTGAACVFTCKGCTEVTRLVGEVGDLRQMTESMKRMIIREGLEEERGVTGIQQDWKKRRRRRSSNV